MEARQVPTPTKLTVDFSNVEDRREGGKSAHVPEGDYLLKIGGVELKTKKDDETSKYLSWRFTIAAPEKYKNAGSIYYVTSLKPESLWSLRNLLDDMGITVPKKAVGLPLAEIAKSGRLIGATLEDDEYNGKVKSKIAATFKKDQYEATSTPTATEDEEESSETEEDETEELDIDDI
jgi:hypothetical protein